MHYFVDGYNILFRISVKKTSLQQQRDQLIREFSSATSNIKISITLVFDSKYQTGIWSREHINDLEIIFSSEGQTADEFIIEELQRVKNPRQHTVATSDNPLARQARHLGARSISAEDFMDLLDHRINKKNNNDNTSQSRYPKNPSPKELDNYVKIFEERFKKLQ